MALSEATHHKLIWGWLRLFLGILQMFLATAALGSLILVGLHPVTLGLGATATIATLISRTLYRGRPDPGRIRSSARKESRDGQSARVMTGRERNRRTAQADTRRDRIAT